MKEEVRDWLDEQPFYEAMQAYRHSPLTDPARTVAAFEAVKQMVRAEFTRMARQLEKE